MAVILAPMQTAQVFPEDLVVRTARWLREFAVNWHQELPQQIHLRDEIAEGGAPEFHPDFLAVIDRPCRKPNCYKLTCTHNQNAKNPRVMTQKAFNRLRRVAPREFDVLYLFCARGLTFNEIADKLTERAVRLKKPERYSVTDVLALAISGSDKVSSWI